MRAGHNDIPHLTFHCLLLQDVQLNELELALASNLVNPVSIRVGFDDVGGLDDVVTDLGESVILPLKNECLFKSSKLLQPPKGVLLYGPPGCGKTMIAKATAREAGTVQMRGNAAR